MKSIATLTIHDAPDLTDEGRRMIAEWLRKQAKIILKESSNLSKRYTARYLRT